MTSGDEFKLYAVDQQGVGLGVCFRWCEDRFVHEITRHLADGESSKCLRSVEGDSQDAWPLSPPLQQIHYQEVSPGQRCIFAVGMAGTSHWSLVVEAVPQSRRLEFDVACRMSVVPTFLGSTYRPANLEDPSLGPKIIAMPPQVDANQGAQISQVTTVLPMNVDFPVTARWKYSVEY